VDGGPGVLITEWISNGTVFFLNNPILPTNNLRIYPTDLVRTDGDNTYRSYRILFWTGREPDTVGLFPDANDNWLGVDGGIYNNQSIDGVIVGFEKDGVVQSLYLDALVVNLTRSNT